jgi:hypothetical protein
MDCITGKLLGEETDGGGEKSLKKARLHRRPIRSLAIVESLTGEVVCSTTSVKSAATFLRTTADAIYQMYWRANKAGSNEGHPRNKEYIIKFNDIRCPHCGERII